ncbi:excisionase [Rhodococcus sp. SC4]|nr:excisionase [Rhodococcus sp. SC4]
MNDLSIRAARIQLRALIAALIVAIAIAVGITTGAFVLSFAVQRDLALQAGIPHYLTWIFPAIVDGAILGATIAIVALSKINGSATGKHFFLWLAVVVVFISVFGNAYHAYRAGEAAARSAAAGIDLGYTPLTPTGASLIAVIPPLLVLAFTHGVGILIKAIGTAHTEYTAVVRDTRDREQQDGKDIADHYPMAAAESMPTSERNVDHIADIVTPSIAPDPDVAPRIAPDPDVAPRIAQTVAQFADVATAGDSSALDDSRAAAVTGPERSTGVADAAQPTETNPDDRTDVATLTEEHVARSALDGSNAAALKVSNALEDSQEPFVLPDEAQTIENLLDFIETCADFEPVVKETARLRIIEQHSYAEIATLTRAKAASTAMRRFDKVAQRAVDAGFRTPPLPELEEIADGRNAATLDPQYTLVGTP